MNAAGQVVPHQVIEDEERFWMEVLKPNRKRCVRVLFPAQIPALRLDDVLRAARANSGRLLNCALVSSLPLLCGGRAG